MSRRRHPILNLLILAVPPVAIGCLLWLGLVPARLLPFRQVDLADPSGVLLDLRLASLRRDPETCAVVLQSPHIRMSTVPDRPFDNGCGWENAVRVRAAGSVSLPIDKISCQMAAALALWLTHEVQPLATLQLGQRVASVSGMGAYNCRNIVGNRFRPDTRSEHATANAFDISGFTLADGRQISVRRHWGREAPEGQFLRDVHRRACRYFRVALSPEFNAAHRDHFHLDRGNLLTCR